MRLKDRVAIIAGGSAGIGEATAKLFAKEGAKVVVAARTQPRLNEVLRAVQKFGDAIAVEADTQKEADVAKMCEAAMKKYGRIDIMAAVAGYGGRVVKPAIELSLKEWNEVFDGNMTNTFLCSREALKYMIPAKRGGSILTFSSAAASTGNLNRSAYSAAKAAVVGYTRALAREVGPHGIRVNCISPVASTEKLMSGLTAQAQRIGTTLEAVKKGITTGAALGRMPTPEEVAYTCLYLACDESSGITGQTIDVNCGTNMR
ncbi:MAG: SDR family oxidoreductase [Chloroflexi bacterium]|nr:SDR family oxidoreductase [Chloroflexota bacterium]